MRCSNVIGYRREGFLLALAVGIVGLTFGVLAAAAGLSILQIAVMSSFVFTGASQFAAVSVVDNGGSGAAAVGSAMLLAARNALYGPIVAPLLRISPARRAVAVHLTIDETTAMASAQSNASRAVDAFWWTGFWLWSLWNVGSIGGAVLGTAIDPQVWGLDAAFPAAFVALLTPHIRELQNRVVALASAAIAISMVPFFPPGVPLLAASLPVVPAMWWLVRKEHQ